MATTTISTDYWVDSALAVTSLESDLWDFELTPIPAVTLSTDLWGLVATPGDLPNYSPSNVIAVTKVIQNTPFPQFVMGGQGGASEDQYQLFKKSTSSYGFVLWRSELFKIGTDFDILQITIPLVQAVAAGCRIIPKLYFDDASFSQVGTVINTTNYPNSERLIVLTSKNFDQRTHGKSNFFLELQIASTVLTTVSLPISIELDVNE